METEWARQYGRIADEDISTWGAYGVLGYTPPGWRWSPRFATEYQFGSGDGDAADGEHRTFDQLYPTGHLYQGVADRIGWQNVKDVRAGVTLKPHTKVRLNLDYFNFWLANKRDHLYAVNGAVSVRTPQGGAQSSHVGQEADVVLTWTPAGHATIGGGLGYFFTGDFLKQTTPGRRHVFTYFFELRFVSHCDQSLR
ncbi:MAG: alginate export family protein [Bryobacterales bacterium]